MVNLSNFSSYIFWDTSVDKLDFEKNSSFIIKRVLEYGKISDWILLNEIYGLNLIIDKVRQFKSLDRKTLFFIAGISQTPLNEFKCYTTTPSNQELSIF